MKIKDTALEIIKADITRLKVDGLVRATDKRLLMTNETDILIFKKAGEPLQKEVLKKSPVLVGESVYTRAGKLKAKYIIHSAIVDNLTAKTDETKLRLACRSALGCANRLRLKSVVLPALGFGLGFFPLIGAAKIMTQEVLKYLREYKTTLTKIIFCLDDQRTFKIFDKTVRGYLEHILYKFSEGPFVTVDAIIELKEGIILIERSNPPYGWALPGGFVDYGESLETAVAREAKEETNMELVNLRQFHTYSKPERDPRFHTIGVVFTAKGKGVPKFGDDAAGLRVVARKDLLKLDYAFDHKEIIRDYLTMVIKRM